MPQSLLLNYLLMIFISVHTKSIKFENYFAVVVIEKGIPLEEREKKMDDIRIEAMLSETGVTAESLRILFWLINQFLDKTV